jgi:sigma-B regulation protein RsbU (phosphoserine phosphatase)
MILSRPSEGAASRDRSSGTPYRKAGSISPDIREFLKDYAAAAEFQARLLRRKPPPLGAVDMAALSRPASQLSGDFHDFIRWGQSHLGIVVGDAMGKGLSGSLLMMQTRAAVRALATVTRSPGALVRGVNKVLSPDLGVGVFVTLLVAVLDLSKGELRVANAGHPPVLYCQSRTGRCFEQGVGGFALGVARRTLFERSIIESGMTLEPGTRFVIYSDGVTEHLDAQSREYGKGRLIRHLSRSASCDSDEYLESVASELEVHRAERPPSDDVTLVTGLFRAEDGRNHPRSFAP